MPFFHIEGYDMDQNWRDMEKNGVLHVTYISQMSSGRLAGISVKPLPRQSTTLLLQVQAEGQVIELALHDGGSDWGPETMKTLHVSFGKRLSEILTTKYISLSLPNSFTILSNSLFGFSEYNVLQNQLQLKRVTDHSVLILPQSPLYQSLSLRKTSVVTSMINLFKAISIYSKI